jgi:hypothetical protein
MNQEVLKADNKKKVSTKPSSSKYSFNKEIKNSKNKASTCESCKENNTCHLQNELEKNENGTYDMPVSFLEFLGSGSQKSFAAWLKNKK